MPNTIFDELDPSPRLLMGPGPVNLYPSVLKAISTPLLGQYDPEFTEYMNQVMALYRQVYRTQNQWTILIDGTARAGIEALLSSIICPGDKVLVPIFGRFGYLLREIAMRAKGEVIEIHQEWGHVFDDDVLMQAIDEHQPKVVACVHGDTSTTVMQPLARLGKKCREAGAILYVDCTASLCGNEFDVDAWHIDAASAGLQKCLSGPPGVSPVTFNERVLEIVNQRKHIEGGIRPPDYVQSSGPILSTNYFDLPMLIDYWSPKRLNHHTEAASMLYAARECARVVLREGLPAGIARHHLSSRALRAGLQAMGLELFGDPAHRMHNITGIVIPAEITDEAKLRRDMLLDFGIEIGTSFGPLAGKIWRIGTMGYVCRKANVLRCLVTFDAMLRRHGYRAEAGAAVEAAYQIYDEA